MTSAHVTSKIVNLSLGYVNARSHTCRVSPRARARMNSIHEPPRTAGRRRVAQSAFSTGRKISENAACKHDAAKPAVALAGTVGSAFALRATAGQLSPAFESEGNEPGWNRTTNQQIKSRDTNAVTPDQTSIYGPDLVLTGSQCGAWRDSIRTDSHTARVDRNAHKYEPRPERMRISGA